jgi:hypothetical protein
MWPARISRPAAGDPTQDKATALDNLGFAAFSLGEPQSADLPPLAGLWHLGALRFQGYSWPRNPASNR